MSSFPQLQVLQHSEVIWDGHVSVHVFVYVCTKIMIHLLSLSTIEIHTNSVGG